MKIPPSWTRRTAKVKFLSNLFFMLWKHCASWERCAFYSPPPLGPFGPGPPAGRASGQDNEKFLSLSCPAKAAAKTKKEDNQICGETEDLPQKTFPSDFRKGAVAKNSVFSKRKRKGLRNSKLSPAFSEKHGLKKIVARGFAP
jgi:hypothetical protein